MFRRVAGVWVDALIAGSRAGVEVRRTTSLPMQTCSEIRWRVNGSNEAQVGTDRVLSSRGGHRFAPALISLTLDQVDATELRPGVVAPQR